LALLLLCRARQRDDRDEELVDLAYDLDEAVEVDRLGDVRVRVELVATKNVLVGGRRGEYDDRDVAEIGIRLDLGEYLAPIFAG